MTGERKAVIWFWCDEENGSVQKFGECANNGRWKHSNSIIIAFTFYYYYFVDSGFAETHNECNNENLPKILIN